MPESVWEDVRDEAAAELAVTHYLLFLAAAGFHAGLGDDQDVDDAFDALIDPKALYFSRRSAAAATHWSDRARRRFETLLAEYLLRRRRRSAGSDASS
ncbi:MAG: hypothetical protein DCC67_07825 [Planctomycetota bacterium]|nr:MAG: hypothetical protein DCC67_07825 [Planctomycetota bacterium]